MKKLTKVTPITQGQLRKYILSYDNNGVSSETELISKRDIKNINDVNINNIHPDVFNILITTAIGKVVYLRKFEPTINEYCYELLKMKSCRVSNQTFALFSKFIKSKIGLDMTNITSICDTVYNDISTSNITSALVVVRCNDGKIKSLVDDDCEIIYEDLDVTMKKIISGELANTGKLDITFRLALDNLSVSAMINKLYNSYCMNMNNVIDTILDGKNDIDKIMGIAVESQESEPAPMFGDDEDEKFCYEEN